MSVALVAVVAMSTRQNESLWVSLVLSVGFGHYVLSVIYAKQPIRRVFSHPQSVVALTLFGSGFYALYSRQFRSSSFSASIMSSMRSTCLIAFFRCLMYASRKPFASPGQR